MICPDCGSPPRETGAYCTACGTLLVAAPETDEPPRDTPTAPLTLVAAMVGSERAAWIDSVWGRTAVRR